MNIVFYYDTKGSCVEHSITAPLFAVKAFERGYYPITVGCTAKDLNKEIPDNVLESAQMASCFGWHTPAAKDAVKYVQELEKKIALQDAP